MTEPPAESLLSRLDSERFGIRIGRASVSGSNTAASILAAGERESLRMLIIRCRTDDFASIHALEDARARLMDTLVYYRRYLRKGDLPAELKPNLIRPIEQADLAEIPGLSRLAFQGYPGHYHADPALDQAKCDEGYAEWAAQLCAHRSASQAVFVAEHPAVPLAGFIAARLNTATEAEAVLCGVHPAAEGRGIYWSFMVRVMEWCRNQGAVRIFTSTQITNLTSQKLWIRLGFEPAESFHTFHLWFP